MCDVVGGEFLALHRDADDDVGPHLAGYVDGVVVAQAAVDEKFVAHADGGEDAGDGHRGAHGLLEVAVVEVDFGVVDEVGGHAGEGYGQGVEVDGVEVAVEQLREEAVEVDAADEAAALFVGRYGVPQGIGVLYAAVVDVEGVGVDAVGQQGGPLLRVHDGVHLLRGPADGVEAADERAHGGAADDVDGYAGFFDDFQCAYVSGAFGAATAEDDGNPGALVALGREGEGQQEGGEEGEGLFHIVGAVFVTGLVGIWFVYCSTLERFERVGFSFIRLGNI